MAPFRLRADALTQVEVLLYVQALWKDGYQDLPNLRGRSPAQVLARMPDTDARYTQGEEGLRAILAEIPRRKRDE